MNQMLHTLSSGATFIVFATFAVLTAALFSIAMLALALIEASRMKTMQVSARRHSGIGRVNQGDLAGHTVIETDYRVIR